MLDVKLVMVAQLMNVTLVRLLKIDKWTLVKILINVPVVTVTLRRMLMFVDNAIRDVNLVKEQELINVFPVMEILNSENYIPITLVFVIIITTKLELMITVLPVIILVILVLVQLLLIA